MGNQNSKSAKGILIIISRLMNIWAADQHPIYKEITGRGLENVSDVITSCLTEIEDTFEEQQKTTQKKSPDMNRRARLFYEDYRKLVDKYEIQVADGGLNSNRLIDVLDEDFYYYDIKGE